MNDLRQSARLARPRAALAIAALSLISGLSCSVRNTLDSGLEFGPARPLAAPHGAALGPNAHASAASAEGTSAEATDRRRVEALIRRFRGYQSGLAPFEISRTAQAIVDESRANGLDPELVAAVIQTESAYHNFARSPVGALGLMQLMPPTGQMLAAELDLPWHGPDTLFDPLVNVKLGTRYLAYLHARYKGWRGALAAYNWGPGKIDRRLRAGDALPTLYADKVMGYLRSAALL